MTSKVKFKYPFDVIAQCRVTGFKGTIIVRTEEINGAVQYGIQPRAKDDESSFVPDCKAIDEGYITLLDGAQPSNDEVEFKFDCGDKVRNIVNGFEGTITNRKQWLNGCIQYVVEHGTMVKSELHGLMVTSKTFWEQELEAQKVNKSEPKAAVEVSDRKRSGGPTTSFSAVKTL